jgi:hypothetical protein
LKKKKKNEKLKEKEKRSTPRSLDVFGLGVLLVLGEDSSASDKDDVATAVLFLQVANELSLSSLELRSEEHVRHNDHDSLLVISNSHFLCRAELEQFQGGLDVIGGVGAGLDLDQSLSELG